MSGGRGAGAPPGRHRGRRAGLAWLALVTSLACGGEPTPEDTRPAVLVVVIDTLRADAVSAHGEVAGTTPALDGLAAEGLRYAHAYAPAPWTIPSHASIFTGRRPDRHGVGVAGRVTAPEGLDTLAGRLAAAGYETVGFSENPLVSEPFGLVQGFERFTSQTVEGRVGHLLDPRANPPFGTTDRVHRWSRTRERDRPFLVFVNLFDPHEPYRVRPENPFLPPGATADVAARMDLSTHRICRDLPPPDELAILRGLYLGGVSAADAKLGEIVAHVRRAAGRRPLIVVVTSDHGEHLGEHRLLDHQFSVRNPLLHVPLVVQGLPETTPAVVEAPVGLEDLTPSILAWTGVSPPPALDGRLLPVGATSHPPARSLFAVYTDERGAAAPDWPDAVRIPAPTGPRDPRSACGPEDRVFGTLLAHTRFPYRLIRFAEGPSELYDLRWDPLERSDLASQQPERVAELERTLEAAVHLGDRRAPGDIPPGARERLEALGYAEPAD